MKQKRYTVQFVIDSLKSRALEVSSFEVYIYSLVIYLKDGARITLGPSYINHADNNDIYLNCEFSSLWLVNYYLTIL